MSTLILLVGGLLLLCSGLLVVTLTTNAGGMKAPVDPHGPFGGKNKVASDMDDGDGAERALLIIAAQRQAASDQLRAKIRDSKLTEATALADEVRRLAVLIDALAARV